VAHGGLKFRQVEAATLLETNTTHTSWPKISRQMLATVSDVELVSDNTPPV